MEHRYCAETEQIRIRPLHEEDIEYLRNWRNNKELSVFLSDIPYITQEMQLIWFREYQCKAGTYFFVVIDKDTNKVVGSVAIDMLDGHSFEVGRIVIGDSSAHGRGMGYGALLLAVAIAIKKLNAEIIRLNVHENNGPARNIYERAGFETIGRHEFAKGGYELEMQISSSAFFKSNKLTNEIIIMEEQNMNTVYKVRGGITE